MSTSPKKPKQLTGTNTSVTALAIKLTLHSSVARDLDKLPEKQFRQVEAKINSLRTNPYPADRRPMTDYPGVYRVDSGEYRIGFTEHKTATEHVIKIVLVDRRNDKTFYKSIKRRLDL